MKYVKKALVVLAWLFTLYAGFFFLWVAMITTCIQTEHQCGDDAMTRAVRVLYGPIVRNL